MCTTSVYACNYASCWHDVFRSSYLQRFHTHGPYQQNIDVAGFVFDLTDSQVAFWWNSVGSQFAFLNEDLRHKGTDANILLCFSQKSIDSPTFLLHWNPSQDIKQKPITVVAELCKKISDRMSNQLKLVMIATNYANIYNFLLCQATIRSPMMYQNYSKQMLPNNIIDR